jgi:hypothetical protein
MSGAAYLFLFLLSRPNATLRRLYAEEPRWAYYALRFGEQLTTLLAAVARGAQRPALPSLAASTLPAPQPARPALRRLLTVASTSASDRPT